MSAHQPPKPKPSLTFSHSVFNNADSLGSGVGNRFHTFSSMHFASQQHADDYNQKTGVVTDSGVQQGNTQLKLSRRGSIIGMKPNSDGSVDAFRFSSHPTSRALQQDTGNALMEYQHAAQELQTRAVNTKDKDQTVNTVVSDFGQATFNASQGQFTLQNSTFATGMSGFGLHSHTTKASKDNLFEPSISSMQDRGKTPTSSSAYHSEPMAITFHDQQRTQLGLPSLRQSSGMIGIMESYVNQICAQCGPMLSQRVGSNSLVSGIPGNPFGGQKEGLIKPSDVEGSGGQATVYRTSPISEFGSSQQNLDEVSAIHQYHHGSPFVALSSQPINKKQSRKRKRPSSWDQEIELPARKRRKLSNSSYREIK